MHARTLKSHWYTRIDCCFLNRAWSGVFPSLAATRDLFAPHQSISESEHHSTVNETIGPYLRRSARRARPVRSKYHLTPRLWHFEGSRECQWVCCRAQFAGGDDLWWCMMAMIQCSRISSCGVATTNAISDWGDTERHSTANRCRIDKYMHTNMYSIMYCVCLYII